MQKRRLYASEHATRYSPPALSPPSPALARPLGGSPAFWRAINYSGAAAFSEKEKNAGKSATATIRTRTLMCPQRLVVC